MSTWFDPTRTIRSCKLRILLVGWLYLAFAGTGKLPAQEIPEVRRSLSEQAQKLPLKFPKVYWFNKYKVGIGDYGIAVIKDGVEISDQQDLQTRSRQNFRVFVISKNQDTATVKGRKLSLKEYEYQGQSAMDWALSTFTQIESETLPSLLNSMEILEASISVRLAGEQPWKLYVLQPAGSDHEITGFLGNGIRKLEIRLANYEIENNDREMDSVYVGTHRIELVEDGRSLAAVSQGSERNIWLEPDLDPGTSQILVTACLLLTTQILWW